LTYFSLSLSLLSKVELFALEIFKKADDQYYAGKADKSTTLSFRAAATVMVWKM
jgi:hypothetical protein